MKAALLLLAFVLGLAGYYLGKADAPQTIRMVGIPDTVWVEGPPPTQIEGPPPSRVIVYRDRLVVDTTRCIHPPAEIRTVYMVRDTAIQIRRPILRAPVVSITRYDTTGRGQTLEYRIPPRPWGAGARLWVDAHLEPSATVYLRYRMLTGEIGRTLEGSTTGRIGLQIGLP
jgi:hypothetical protein